MYDDTKINQYSSQNYYESPFNNYLLSGENILWEGQYNKGRKILSVNSFYFLFAVFWLGFSVFWTISATLMGGLFGLFGIPFIAIGIFMMKNNFGSKNMNYAITDMRVMISNGRQFKADMLGNVINISVQKGSDNIGNVLFNIAGQNNYGKNNISNILDNFNGFYGVKDPERVFSILNSAVMDYVKNK